MLSQEVKAFILKMIPRVCDLVHRCAFSAGLVGGGALRAVI